MTTIIDNPQNPSIRCVSSSKLPPCQEAGSGGFEFSLDSTTCSPKDLLEVTPGGTTNPNADIALAPRGTGAFSFDIPDNAVPGGNCRGNNAVDLQMLRVADTDVASGEASAIGGGAGNSASGNNSCVPGGTGNNCAGAGSLACGSTAGDGGLDGCFVFGDGSAATVATEAGQFVIGSAAANPISLPLTTPTLQVAATVTDLIPITVAGGAQRYIMLSTLL